MFTGIIECTGQVEKITSNGSNKTFWIHSPLSKELKTDQSLSHNGVCLTVEEVAGDTHRVTAIEETLSKTNLYTLQPGSEVNLERCMQMNGRLDGHIVQGHVDTTATCTDKKALDGSWEFTFEYAKEFAHLVVETGSISVNGTSLTCFHVTGNSFSVAIIPYTYDHTNIKQVETGSIVNIEFDIIGKYLQRMMTVNKLI
jgi:riboflavin synthase